MLLLVDEGAQLETLHAEADGRRDAGAARVPVEDGLCSTAAVRTGLPVFIRSLEDWQQRFWRSASVAADGGYQSSATLPLLVEGAPAGVLTFHFTVPVNFDDDYQALLVSVAQHCAQALDRARLYESTQRARADAERANRIKDEFVSIVSHELRTPLNAILGWTDMLQRGMLAPEKSARALQSVHDNASRQARLIEELLDFSRVSSGRTSLQMEPVDVRELIRGVVESMIPTAVARAIDLQLSPVPPAVVRGDIRRLEQVCFNLIDNALKFTPDGGRVAIDVRIAGGQVEIAGQGHRRRDGPGVPPRTSSIASARPTAPPAARTAGSDSDCRSRKSWSRRTAAGSPPTATARAPARRSPCSCRSPPGREDHTQSRRRTGRGPLAADSGGADAAARRPARAGRGRRARRAGHHGRALEAWAPACRSRASARAAFEILEQLRSTCCCRTSPCPKRTASLSSGRSARQSSANRVDPGGSGDRVYQRRGSGARARRRVPDPSREAVRALQLVRIVDRLAHSAPVGRVL